MYKRQVLYQGTCVGNKYICRLQDPFAGQNPLTIDNNPNICQLTVHVTAARDEVHMKNIQVF